MSLPSPTALGVKALLFYLLLLGAFLATPYSNLFFLLLAFLTILGALNVYWTVRNGTGVGARIGEIEPQPAGAPVLLQGAIEGDGTAFVLELELEGAGTVRLPGQFAPPERGIYRLAGAYLVSAWPLGLLRIRRPVKAPEELIVYPEPADLTEARGQGGLAPAGGADPIQPAGLREYRPGDEFRAIHWKATARRGQPVVREWDTGTGNGHEVVLDRRATSEALERALSILSALALMARDHKETLTIHSQELSATYGSGHLPWRDCLALLATAQPLPRHAPPPPPVSPGVARL